MRLKRSEFSTRAFRALHKEVTGSRFKIEIMALWTSSVYDFVKFSFRLSAPSCEGLKTFDANSKLGCEVLRDPSSSLQNSFLS
jgi:hypothetical protein